MRLQTKLIILISTLIISVLIVVGLFFQQFMKSTLKEQFGQKALILAEAVASDDEIRQAFSHPEPWTIIQPIVEDIRRRTGAEFIVVGNKDGIRYAHPVADRIGEEMVGGDNDRVLKEGSIISEAVGTLGPSIRGKTLIYDEQGEVIGIVSVGFLIENVNQITKRHVLKVLIFILGVLSVGIVGATLIAKEVKRVTLGLEPQEITSLYQEKQAVMESIREGIVAINQKGYITMANQMAIKMAGLSREEELVGKYLLDVLPTSRLLDIMSTGKAEYDQEFLIGDHVIIANRVPIFNKKNEIIGAVSSFRSKNELYKVTEELSEVKRYAEALRAQTHEFSNKLYLLSGLIQLESYQEALEMIAAESDIHQNLIQFIMKEIPDPMIGGLLIGKFNQASELRVELSIDRESSFRDIPTEIDRSHLVTIIGNLLDNAMDAVLDPGAKAKRVKIFFTDLGDDLIIEVEDMGIGIKEEDRDKIFTIGYSTKAMQHRGFGLGLVQRAVNQLNGHITFSTNEWGGAVFTVDLPKNVSKRQWKEVDQRAAN